MKQSYPEFMPDARFTYVLNLYNLQMGGAQFGLNDLTAAEWHWLAQLKSAIEEYQIKNMKR